MLIYIFFGVCWGWSYGIFNSRGGGGVKLLFNFKKFEFTHHASRSVHREEHLYRPLRQKSDIYIAHMPSYHRVTIGKSKTKLYEWNSIGSWHRTERRYSRYSYSIGGVSIILMGVSAVDLSIIKISDLMSTPALHRKWYFMKSLYSMESTKYKNNYLKCKNYNCSTIRKRQY